MGEICLFHSKNVMLLSIVEGEKEEKLKSSLEAKAFQVDLQDSIILHCLSSVLLHDSALQEWKNFRFFVLR